jgi:hypothetical protein
MYRRLREFDATRVGCYYGKMVIPGTRDMLAFTCLTYEKMIALINCGMKDSIYTWQPNFMESIIIIDEFQNVKDNERGPTSNTFTNSRNK